MLHPEHMDSSKRVLKYTYPEFCFFESDESKYSPEAIEKGKQIIVMMDDLHYYIDRFSWKKGVYKGKSFDFTKETCEKFKIDLREHRKLTHHLEGLAETIEYLSEKYGDEHRKMFRYHAVRHLRQDFPRREGRLQRKKDWEDQYHQAKQDANSSSAWV